MKNFNFQIVPLATEIAEAARQRIVKGAPDHALITVDLPDGYPCRHCLRYAEPGERVILFPYASIPDGHPYAETGPIFVHAEPCERYGSTDQYPAEFRHGRVFRAYDVNFDMIDAMVPNGSQPEEVIAKLFENPKTALVQARSVARGCYTFGIERR